MLSSVAAPVIRVTNNVVHTSSQDVAAYFGKRHEHVLRSIDRLVGDLPGIAAGGLPKIGDTPLFLETKHVEHQNGQAYRSFIMDRDGFVLLAMGFTGRKALAFKLAYIRAFNDMEEAHYYPKAGGSLCISDAAKTLGLGRDELTRELQALRWIFKRRGGRSWLAYDAARHAGHMEHSEFLYPDANGVERIRTQALITGKGLAKLSSLITNATRHAFSEGGVV